MAPGYEEPLMQLVSLAVADKKLDVALAKLEGALQVNPQSLPAFMLSGVIYERRGAVSKAKEVYEKVLALNPRFAPAANNLAFLLVANQEDKERSLQLAPTAKEAAANEPHVTP